MLTLIALVVVLAVALSIRAWARARLNATNLGTMSDQWLNEHRATHSGPPNS